MGVPREYQVLGHEVGVVQRLEDVRRLLQKRCRRRRSDRRRSGGGSSGSNGGGGGGRSRRRGRGGRGPAFKATGEELLGAGQQREAGLARLVRARQELLQHLARLRAGVWVRVRVSVGVGVRVSVRVKIRLRVRVRVRVRIKVRIRVRATARRRDRARVRLGSGWRSTGACVVSWEASCEAGLVRGLGLGSGPAARPAWLGLGLGSGPVVRPA